MDVKVGLWRRLSTEELMLLNCGVGEDSWESLGLQGDPTYPFWRRSAPDFFGRNDAKAETPVLWAPHEELTYWKRLMLGGIGGRRRRGRQRMRWLDGITDLMDMSLGNSGSWWWTGRPRRVVVHGVTKSQTQLSNWTKLPLTYPGVATIFLSQVINALLKNLFLLLSGTFRKLLFMLCPTFIVVFGSRETIFCVMQNIKYFWDKNNVYSWCCCGIF